MLFTPYCTFHNLLKNSFQESPIGNPFKNLFRNPFGIWNFISISIQKIDIANTKCKMPEKIWLNTKERKDHVWIIDYGTLKHFHNRVKYGVCVRVPSPSHTLTIFVFWIVIIDGVMGYWAWKGWILPFSITDTITPMGRWFIRHRIWYTIPYGIVIAPIQIPSTLLTCRYR